MTSHIRTLLSRLFGTLEYKILIVGLDASGKTQLLYKLKLNEDVNTVPTVGFNVETVECKKTSLTIWDVGGGCSKIRPLWRHYFEHTQGLIFIVDSHDKSRLKDATDELELILKANELIHIPLLIYLNKIDLPDGMTSDDVIQGMRLNTIRNRQWFVQSCSVKTTVGLYEGLDWLLEAMKSFCNASSRPELIELNASNDGNKTLEWLSRVDEDTNEEFLEIFQQHKLSIEAFDHRLLLRVIWTNLKIYGRKETVKILFDHLKFYVRDFNETLIYFWIQIVHYAFETTRNPTNDFMGFLLMNPLLLNETELPLSYYKKDTLFSDQAKTTVVLPDIKSLPNILPASSASTINRVEKFDDSVNSNSDDEFLRQFESCSLTDWSHKTHLRMAWLYLTRDGRRVGVNKIFDGIKKFIDHSQIARKTTFHFTMTYFWIQMIDFAIAQSPNQIDFDEFLRLNSHLMNKSLFLEYYKKETILNDPIARQEMVLPDIKQLPTLVILSNKK